MTDEEVSYIENQITESAASPFITSGSDIEAYFINPNHLSIIYDKDISSIEEWLKEIIQENLPKIYVDFTHKRDELKRLPLYNNNNIEKPDTTELINQSKTSVYDSIKIVKGKFLKKKINGSQFTKFGCEKNIIHPTEYIDIPELRILLKEEATV